MSDLSLDPELIKPLYNYNACDISDALLKLGVPHAGYLADLTPYTTSSTNPNSSSLIDLDPSNSTTTPTPNPTNPNITIAPASTVLFAPKSTANNSTYGPSNIPPSTHWADLTPPGTICILSQPPNQKNAVLGGIMALRLKMLGVHGIVVSGRIRDMAELKETGLPTWAEGTSTVGAGAESKAMAVGVPVMVGGIAVDGEVQGRDGGVVVKAGDCVFMDAGNGVVVIPREKLESVVEILPGIVGADDRVKVDVAGGMSVWDAFRKHRGG